MRGDLIHALRKRKATDAYSRLEDIAEQTPTEMELDNLGSAEGFTRRVACRGASFQSYQALRRQKA